jgi:anthranilate/para-aminobenzoate synthase component I
MDYELLARADSVPAREYEESMNKARAILRAFELAEKGL